MVPDHTPIIVGIGQYTERLDSPDYRGLSPTELAAEAARRAIADAGATRDVAGAVDALGAIRTFEDSTPRPTPFGKPDKFPRAIARCLGIEPATAILEKAGGQSPLALIADLANRIARGDVKVAITCGSEAISTTRHLSDQGETRDWRETLDGTMEDHGPGLAGIMKRYHMVHGLTGAPAGYALFENARRARLGLSREAYAKEMGRLFAPFTEVAAANPYSSAATRAMSADELVTVVEIRSTRRRPCC
jgi:acetyl-CoA C-acetyltransferase